jgi:MFS family permease
MMVQMAASNTLLQTLVDDDKRGRVMSFYTMAFMGMTTFGSLLAGWLASKIGAGHTVLIGGVLCVVGALIFSTHRQLLQKAIGRLPLDAVLLPNDAYGSFLNKSKQV